MKKNFTHSVLFILCLIQQIGPLNAQCTASISGASAICAGQSATLTASGGATYLWSNGQTSASITVAPGATTVYTVTVTTAAGCTSLKSAAVAVSPAMLLKTDALNAACKGVSTGSIDLTVQGGAPPYTYDWADVNGAKNAEDRGGLKAGRYAVTVTDAVGCIAASTIDITEPSALTMSSIKTNVWCNEGTDGALDIAPAGGTPPYTYDWSNDGPDAVDNDPQDLVGLSVGVYTLTVTDMHNCSVTQNFSVSRSTVSISGAGAICAGQSVTLTALGGATYIWSTGETSASITVAPGATTVYAVTVTNAAGCTSMKSAAVAVSPAMTLKTEALNTACNSISTGSIDLTTQGGAPPYTYDWADVSGAKNQEDRSGLKAGFYIVTVTDMAGCTSVNKIEIKEPPMLTISGVKSDGSSFVGKGGAIDITPAGGTPPYTYDWSNDGPDSPDNDSQDLAGLAPGTYTVTVTDANTCSAVQSFFVSKRWGVVEVAPHPFSDRTILTLTGLPDQGDYLLRLFDDKGRLVRSWSETYPQFVVDREGLPAGIYLYRVFEGEQAVGSGRLVVFN